VRLRECREVVSKEIVRNAAGSSSTGTATGIVRGLSSLLYVQIGLLFVPATRKRPSAFTGNTFSLYGYQDNERGELHQLSASPINNDGAGGQNAPGGYEGRTQLAAIGCTFSYTGISDAGSWELYVVAEPAFPMPDELFEKLVKSLSIDVPKQTVTT